LIKLLGQRKAKGALLIVIVVVAVTEGVSIIRVIRLSAVLIDSETIK
jgi:hypothetical protein